jgi:DHA1 family tetracycline resistance protein-like MFS transporter
MTLGLRSRNFCDPPSPSPRLRSHPVSSPAPRSSLLIIFLVVFIDLLGFGIVLPLLPRYAEAFHADRMTLGLLMASFSAMQFLIAPIWGRISDRIGRRPILLVGLAGSTIFYGLFGYISSLGVEGKLFGLGVIPWLFITRIGQGIAGATIPTAQAYIADSTNAQGRGKGMALIGAAFGLGFTFGPLMAIPFVDPTGAEAPSGGPGYLASVVSFVAFLAAVVLLPESLPPGGRNVERHWLDLSALRRAFANSFVAKVLLTLFLTTFAFAEFETTLALLTKAMGLGDRWNYGVFAYLGFTLMICQGMIVRRLIPRLGERRTALIGAGLLAVGLLLVGLVGRFGIDEAAAIKAVASRTGAAPAASATVAPGESSTEPADANAGLPPASSRATFYALLAILPIAVLGFSFLNPSLQSLLSLNTADTDQGQVLGLGQSLSALARIGGPFIGITISKFGIHWPHFSAAAVMLAGIAMVARLQTGGTSPAAGSPPS